MIPIPQVLPHRPRGGGVAKRREEKGEKEEKRKGEEYEGILEEEEKKGEVMYSVYGFVLSPATAKKIMDQAA